jgi:RNA polymerase sigma factor (sigma-70 family)
MQGDTEALERRLWVLPEFWRKLTSRVNFRAEMFLAKNKKLLEAFKKGDREAMDVVYRHYFRGVTSFLRKGFTFRSGTGHFFFKGIQDPNELKSAVQEVFRRSFEERARQSYNGVNSFTNWVLAIGRNMVINQFRNREIAFSDYISASDERGHLAIMDDEITEEFSGVLYGRPAKPQDSQFENGELKRLIDEFTKELTEHDRQLLILRFAEGLGQEETAKQLDSTRMKVRTAESRLRSRLRAYLRDSGYIDNMAMGKNKGEGPDEDAVDAEDADAAAQTAASLPADEDG